MLIMVKSPLCVVQAVPEPSNRDGSILTIYSADGLEFGFIFFARLGAATCSRDFSAFCCQHIACADTSSGLEDAERC